MGFSSPWLFAIFEDTLICLIILARDLTGVRIGSAITGGGTIVLSATCSLSEFLLLTDGEE